MGKMMGLSTCDAISLMISSSNALVCVLVPMRTVGLTALTTIHQHNLVIREFEVPSLSLKALCSGFARSQ